MTRRNQSHRYPRTARLNELIREIVAGELERIDDDRLSDVAITSIDVESDLRRGVVWFDTYDPADDDDALAAFDDHRYRLQRAIGAQTRVKRTPILEFRVDQAIRNGERIEAVLRTVTYSDHPEVDDADVDDVDVDVDVDNTDPDDDDTEVDD